METLTRSDVEEVLKEGGFRPGAPNEDPDKDATHIWRSPAGDKFVMFPQERGDGEEEEEEEDDDGGTVVYGDLKEAGVTLSYEHVVSVLAGIVTARQAERMSRLPASVEAKLTSHIFSDGGRGKHVLSQRGEPTIRDPQEPKRLKGKVKGKGKP